MVCPTALIVMNDATISLGDDAQSRHAGDSAPVAPPGYALLEEVGRGGMGVVYRARDLGLDREVAVKLLRPGCAPDSGAARRFMDEARITARLQHPGIPAVYQVGIADDGRPFLAMKLIKGDTLDVLLAQGEPQDKLGVFQAVAQAVAYAHARGIIHRDLKPQNVMVGAFGEVQVMDWGLAKLVADRPSPPPASDQNSTVSANTIIRSTRDGADSFTQYGSALGTPAFMPPEQAAGELDKIDLTSDVFGLGAILCVLLTGKPPFSGENAEAVRLAAVRGQTAAALDRLAACGADPGAIALATRCLAVDPADRPADAGVVAAAVDELRRAADDRARAADVERGRAEVRAAEAIRRRRNLYLAEGVVAAVLILGVAGTTVGLVRATYARRDAEAAEQFAKGRQAEAETARTEAQARATEAAAALRFVRDRVFVAARPKGRPGGLGKDVTLRAAVMAGIPALADEFADQPLVEARLRGTLGDTLMLLGERQAAAEQFERAVALATKPLGPDHPTVLEYNAGLADAYNELGRYADAHRIWEAVAAGRGRSLGPDHPDTLAALFNLCIALARMRRQEEALAAGERALAAHRRALGSDHPDTLRCGRQIVNNCVFFGQHARAEQLARELISAWERGSDPIDPRAVLVRLELAKILAATARERESVELVRRCWRDIARHEGTEDGDTLETLFLTAAFFASVDPGADALAAMTASRTAHLRLYGPRHPATLQNADTAAKLLLKLGRNADALALLEPQVAAQADVLGPDHADTLWGTYWQAVALLRLGRGAEALPLLDGLVERAARNSFTPFLWPVALQLKARHLRATKDAAGCRAVAEKYEQMLKSVPPLPLRLYQAACLRAVAAGCHTDTGEPEKASADADRAMAWLRKAVAAGYRNRVEILGESDLDPLRGRADFKELLGTIPEATTPPRPVR